MLRSDFQDIAQFADAPRSCRRRRKAELLAEGVREVAVTREAKLVREGGEVLRAAFDALERGAYAEHRAIAMQGDARVPLEHPREVERRRVHEARDVGEAHVLTEV